MSALLQPSPRIEPMSVRHLDVVTAIEAAAYAFPWSRGNFIDSLAAGYLAEVLVDVQGRVQAYHVSMHGVDEMHLLNLTVAPLHWGQGLGRRLLDRLVRHAAAAHAASVWLEVRESNERARRIYERYGFVQVGVRRGYYPALHGMREDAMVMSLPVEPAGGGADGHGVD